MEPVIITQTQTALPAGGVQFDFYCEAYSCWMLKSACKARQRRATTGHYENRAIYASAGCGNCRQLKMGGRVEEKIGKDEKKCKGPCGRVLHIDEFSNKKKGKNGKDSRCKQCRARTSKEWHEKNKKNPARKKLDNDDTSKEKPSKLTLQPREADAPLHPPEFSLIGPLSDQVTVDFTGRKDILDAISDVARAEFRPLGLQILYMLHKQVNQT